MNIVYLNKAGLRAGKDALELYTTGLLCGPETVAYDAGMMRETGLRAVPGVIEALIERGVVAEADIISAAARVSRCRRSTVRAVLEALTGDDPALHRWFCEKGKYRSRFGTSDVAAPFLLVA